MSSRQFGPPASGNWRPFSGVQSVTPKKDDKKWCRFVLSERGSLYDYFNGAIYSSPSYLYGFIILHVCVVWAWTASGLPELTFSSHFFLSVNHTKPSFSFLRFPLPNNNQRAPTKFGENLFAHNKGIVRQTFISERGKISSRNITVLPAAPSQMLMGSVGTEVNGHKLCREKNKQRDACHPSCGGIA